MITFEITGTLPKFNEDGMDDVMKDISTNMFSSVQMNFDKGGRPLTWAPLKRTGKPSHLTETGRLRRSIYKDNYKDGEVYTAEVGVPTGPALPYSAIHQFGGVIRNGFGKGIVIGMPQRKYLMFQEGDGELYAKQIGEDMMLRLFEPEPIER